MNSSLVRRAVSGAVALALAGTLAVVGTVAPATPPAVAADKDDIQRKVEENAKKRADVEELLEDTQADLAAAYLKLHDAQADLDVAKAELAVAETEYATAKRTADDLADRLAAAERQRSELQTEIAENDAEAADASAALAEVARQVQQGAGLESSELGILLQAGSLQDLADTMSAQDAVTRTQNAKLSDLQALRGANNNRKAKLDAIEGEISDLKIQADAALKVAEDAKKKAEDKKAETETLVATQTQLTQDLESAKTKYQDEQDALDAEQQSLASELQEIARKERERAAAAGETVVDGEPAPTVGSLGAPLSSMTVSSPYGWRVHPIYHVRKLHNGVDLRASCGTPIYAAAAGKVIKASYSGGAGNFVLIDHGMMDGSPTMTGYMHLSKYNTSVGAQVAKGDVVGYVGTTGASTGCHLHYSLYKNGSTVDPMPYY